MALAGWRGTQGKAVKYVPLWVSLSLMLGCSGRCEYSEPQIPAADYALANSPRVPAPPVVVTTAASYAYPLKVAANGRYLIDQNNKPFRIQGDSAQSLIANLTYAEAVTYLTDRQAKGFNTVNINLLEHKFAVDAPANRNGDAPFTTPGDFSTPNDAWRRRKACSSALPPCTWASRAATKAGGRR